MTTELIGIPGATAAKASVAVVARGIGQELADLLSRSEHEHDVFSDWSEFRAASSEGQQWDLLLYDVVDVGQVPEDVGCPAVLVGDHHESAMPIATLEQSLEPVAAMAAELRVQVTRRHQLEKLVEGLNSGEALAGRCPIMRRVQSAISRAADSDATVLIEGPVGTGKSLAARMIHCKSRRANKSLQLVDSSTVDANAMVELLSVSGGTTLVLESVDQLPGPAQSVLVKHLKERSSPHAEGASRLVATTSAHLPEAIARGAFREDLYYRLNAFPLVMPALRERLADLGEIAKTILLIASAQSGRPTSGLSPAAIVLLESMQWPGNVTQLEAVVNRAHVLAGGAQIDREHVAASSPASASAVATGSPAASNGSERDIEREVSEDEIRTFDEEEQFLLSRALRATKGNVRRAAQLLGIGRATLYRKIQQYKLRLQ